MAKYSVYELRIWLHPIVVTLMMVVVLRVLDLHNVVEYKVVVVRRRPETLEPIRGAVELNVARLLVRRG